MGMRWGPAGKYLNIFDLGIITHYSYEKVNEEYDYLMDQSFQDALGIHGFTTLYKDPFDTGPGKNGAYIPRVTVTRRHNWDQEGVIVVAVKGSALPNDFLADASLYAGVKVFQWVS